MEPAQKQPSSKLWQEEYAMGGIPSSHRQTPSGAVVWAWDQLARERARFKNAVDIGCGKGRNTLFLAEKGLHVTALDFTTHAIEVLLESAAAHKLTARIQTSVQNVIDQWPVKNTSVDLAIDTFCFKHITGKQERLAYKANLLNSLTRRGFYLISFASIGDGYYGKYIRTVDKEGHEAITVDPANSIESVLYSRDRIVEYFKPELKLYAERYTDKPDTMHGATWQRQTYALLFQRTQGLFRMPALPPRQIGLRLPWGRPPVPPGHPDE